MPFLTNTSVIYEPTITVGSVDIALSLLSNTSLLYEPELDYTITLPAYTNTSVLYPPRIPGTGLPLNYWNGSIWVTGTLKAWTGAAWEGTLRYYDGADWN
jgi:hypothetical protein